MPTLRSATLRSGRLSVPHRDSPGDCAGRGRSGTGATEWSRGRGERPMNTATATLTAPLPTRNRLALVGFAGLIGLAAALQVSIAAAGICLGITLTFWVLSLVVQHQRVQVPGMFVPLLVYAAVTLVSSAFAIDPRASF